MGKNTKVSIHVNQRSGDTFSERQVNYSRYKSTLSKTKVPSKWLDNRTDDITYFLTAEQVIEYKVADLIR